MPKVISGILKGRNINGYNIEGTRPTMDRVKESVFGIIQDYIDKSVVLDLFSGSGNLGIEALSNGAEIVYFNDYNKKCINTIKDNLIKFNIINKSILLNFDYRECLNYLHNKKIKFDIIFLDPPYKYLIINDILNNLIEKDLLNSDAIIICEMEKIEYFDNEKLKLIKEKKYGSKFVLIYKSVKLM